MNKAILDIKALLNGAERQQEFDTAVELSDGELDLNARILGKIVNMSGYVLLEAQIKAFYKTFCSFCLRPLDRELEISLSMPVAQSLQNSDNDDYIIAEGGMLDLEELARVNIILNMPMQELCRDDCKGLCPVCGRDKNEGDCTCEKKEPDPRWQKLRDSLKD